MASIYYAEDEESVQRIVAAYLLEHDMDVTTFATGDELLRQFAIRPCDIVLLDIMMPGISGIDAASALRSFSPVPIIMLTAKDTTSDFTHGLASGADDYIAKPFELPILLAKIRALLRRRDLDSDSRATSESRSLRVGNVTLSPARREATVGEAALNLTSLEYELLRYLLENCGRALSRADILSHVWGIDEELSTRAADETNRRLRKKLMAAGATIHIHTIWGFGFKLVEDKDSL